MAVTQFGQFGLDESLLEALEKNGLVNPTPIQAKAIPVLNEGKDVLGIAQTGTGKTAAFVLPILERLLALKGAPEKKTVRALIVVPTRELANQVADTVKKMSEFTRLSSFTIVGGVKADPQIRALNKGLDVCIATPGRLEDHLKAKVFSLESTVMIALDEADQMLDMGFVPAIRRIMGQMPRKKQAALFSATMPPAIKDLASKFMYQPREISVAPANKPISSIEQRVYGVAQSRKQSALIQQLGEDDVELSLVFVRTKRGADRVAKVLNKAGIACEAIHGDRSQGQRDRALKAFRDGRTKILVATDVAARGIDVPNVSHVINFDLPQQAESYVHRIGRTARAGASGVAITFMNPTERGTLKDIERITKQKFDVVPLKVEDQTSSINESVQAEQSAEEEAAKERRMAKEARGKGRGKPERPRRGKDGKDSKEGGERREFKDRKPGAKRDDSWSPEKAKSKKPKAKPADQNWDDAAEDKRDEERRQAQNADAFDKKNKKQGQRARKRERSEFVNHGGDKPHRAVHRDADKEWEASFEADMSSADGLDTAKRAPGKAKAKPKPRGKSNKPNSRRTEVAKGAADKKKARYKAGKKPEAKPRGFIKK